MIRNLYRTYLYIVCIVLLIVVSIAVDGLLNVILLQTPLRFQNEAPDRAQVVQAVTFAIVAFIVAGLIGGLHYWLLRRDMSADPSAGGGGVRSFFLNISAAIAILIAIEGFASTLAQIGYESGPSFALAYTLAAGGFYAVVEWERRRSLATTRAALAFQRLHLFGVPFVTVLFAASTWMGAVSTSLAALFERLGLITPCTDVFTSSCYYNYYGATARTVVTQWAAVVWLAAAWYAYVWLARRDVRSAIRQVLHLAGLAAGLIFAVVGVQRGIEAAFRALFGVPVNWVEIADGTYNFIGLLSFGFVVFAAYFVLYRREAEELPTGGVVGMLTLRALSGLIFAVPFWWGCGLVLEHIVQHAVPAGSNPGPEHLANALALLIAGLGYPSLALTLARGSTSPETAGPRRAFVLALLAGGTITGVVGLVIALRAVITSALGAPLEDSTRVALDGAVTLVIGGIIAGLYGWLAAREHVFTLPASLPSAAPAPVETTSIESVLDELLAGKLTRDAAAARIRQLPRSQS